MKYCFDDSWLFQWIVPWITKITAFYLYTELFGLVPSNSVDDCQPSISFSFFLFFFVCLFVCLFLGLHLQHLECPRLAVELELQLLVYSNTRSEPCLWPTPQITAMLDPQPTERGQGLNPTSSWILVRVTSAVPQQELPSHFLLCRADPLPA